MFNNSVEETSMDLRQVIDRLGLSQIALAREANLSRFKLYQFLNGDVQLDPIEERALHGVLAQHADQTEKAIEILRQAAQA